MNKTHYFVPARMGSKGLPLKNRKLFDLFVVNTPVDKRRGICVGTDDPVIAESARHAGFDVLIRDKSNTDDTASVKSAIREFVKSRGVGYNDKVVVLYLTYPERTWGDVDAFMLKYEKSQAKSMMCRKEVKSHPYLCMYDEGDMRGRQVVRHDKYRRQDYPKCFEISHFIFAMNVSELNKLNCNLYNKNTLFHEITDVVDVDTPADLVEYNEKKARGGEPGVFITTACTRTVDSAIECIGFFRKSNSWFTGDVIVLWSDLTGTLSPVDLSNIKNIGANPVKVVESGLLGMIHYHRRSKTRGFIGDDRQLYPYAFKYADGGVIYCDNGMVMKKDLLEGVKTDSFSYMRDKVMSFGIRPGIARKSIYENCVGYARQFKNKGKNDIRLNTVESFLKSQYNHSRNDVRDEYIDIVVLGNDRNLSNISGNSVFNTITVGINRSYMILKTNYLFFNDVDIATEIIKNGVDIEDMRVVCSDRINYDLEYNKKGNDWRRFNEKHKPVIYDRVNRNMFPDSVCSALDVFTNKIYPHKNVRFKIYGVSLKFDNECNHFWKDKKDIVLNKKHRDWYEPRFDSIYNNFKKLKALGYDITSLTPGSRLNDLFKYEPIEKYIIGNE